LAGQFIDPNAAVRRRTVETQASLQMVEDEVWANGMKELKEGGQFDPDGPVFHDANGTPNNAEEEAKPAFKATLISNPCVTPFPSAFIVPGMGSVPIRKESVIVIIRHGKTEHNKLGLFTGWEDAPLASDGVVEARAAGRLLKSHGFEFDVVYTSWLRLLKLLCMLWTSSTLWLPIVQWRLNERCYGS
jgi:2,3-bisphosphoglycerate-dependent phosphoglycerate mutase